MENRDVSEVERWLERGIKLPAQPRILDELQSELSKGEVNIRRLTRIIAGDPALVAMFFKIARSAAYGGGKLESLDKALMLIGAKQALNYVRALELSSSVSDKRHNYEAFWARSSAIATLAGLVSDERISVCNIFPDQAYLAGMFLDCGIPLLMERFPDYGKSLGLDRVGTWPEVGEEDKRFHVDHCVIGYLVAKHWRLPDFICDAIRFHHELLGTTNPASRTMVAVLYMASQLYHNINRMDNPEWAAVESEVLAELCLSQHDLKGFSEKVLDRFCTD